MTLENDFLRLEFTLLGAELKSVWSKQLDREIAYPGNTDFWNRSAPVLFPIVGKLKDNSYRFQGKTYSLNQHGFARDSVFEIATQGNEFIEFVLKSNEKTRGNYPFDFELSIRYALNASKVSVNYRVKNSGASELPFSIGGHPAFRCPLFDDEDFCDYSLEFEQLEPLERHLLDPKTGLFSGKKKPLLTVKQHLDLSYDWFLEDALVFKDLKFQSISLKNKRGNYALKFSFVNLPYFGIWTKKDAPFICLEPWAGLADSVFSSGEITEKEGINLLKAGEIFEAQYAFELLSF